MPLRRLMFPSTRQPLIRIERARNHRQSFVEDALIRSLKIAFLLNEQLEVRALRFFRAPACVLKNRIEQIRALRIWTNPSEHLRALGAQMLKACTELLHLDRMSFDSFFALTDQRKHDRRYGRFGAGRRDECFGRTRRRTVTWRRTVAGRRSRITRRRSVRRTRMSLRRARRKSIHGSQDKAICRQSQPGVRERDLLQNPCF